MLTGAFEEITVALPIWFAGTYWHWTKLLKGVQYPHKKEYPDIPADWQQLVSTIHIINC